MAINNFKPFATAANANVMSQADWEALPALLSGFMAGKASSAQVNKAIRQASFIAAALAQYTANKSGLDILDDGDLNGFITKMSSAFGKDYQALDATLTALAGLATGANKLPYFTDTDKAAQTDLTQVGRDIIGKNTIADILTYLGLVPAIVLPSGYNIPFHIRNTPGILYSAQHPGTYTNEPDFDNEWFDVFSSRHTSGDEGACTFIAVSQSGKVATASLIDTTFSGWNRVLDGTNSTQAGRDLINKDSSTEMVKYLGLDNIPGRLLNVKTITVSGTYTPTSGTKSIIVEAIGGGGASGNLTATGATQNAVSAAGSNGAYAKARYTSGFSSVSVTIGAGGTVAGGGAGSGGDGGATSFGSLLTCPAGKGSPAGTAKTPPFNEGAAQPSGAPSGTGILISNKGPYSTWPTVVALGSASNFINAIGSQLGSYGLGGDGIAANVSESAKSGVAGNSGCVIVWEYA
ncbi:hypothetical protein [Citrobacter sedlakii]|uniref:hypothetical protein n=1 Tax=Citrobacter sedlakii TaxID=67826 RepID=UPI003B26BF46